MPALFRIKTPLKPSPWSISLLLVAGILLAPRPSFAEDCRSIIERLLTHSDKIEAAKADYRSGESGLEKARSAWFPQVALNGEYGNDHEKVEMQTTNMVARQLDVSITQPLWDMNKTNGNIDHAEALRQQLDVSLTKTRQDVILEGLQAYVDVIKARRTVAYAEQSVKNIRKQTGMEESRVEIGGGLPTDVLQAKSQLAGAQARLTRAQGSLAAALNRYRTIFKEEPPAEQAMEEPALDLTQLPPDLEQAVRQAMDNSPELRIAQYNVSITTSDIDRTIGSELGPQLSLVGDAKASRNMSGTVGGKQEQSIKLQFSLPFNTGLGGFAAVEAARHTAAAASSRALDTRQQVEQQVRNAWQAYLTAKDNANYLRNQAHISAEFLRLAQQERVLGRRSLIDVLSGETSLINALSDAATAEADVISASYSVLRLMGSLDPAVIRSHSSR